jgi:hypothetical protein
VSAPFNAPFRKVNFVSRDIAVMSAGRPRDWGSRPRADELPTLKHVSCPDYMRSRTTFRFTLWGAEEANGNVGQTEVLKFPETSRTQFARHFSWIEMA